LQPYGVDDLVQDCFGVLPFIGRRYYDGSTAATVDVAGKISAKGVRGRGRVVRGRRRRRKMSSGGASHDTSAGGISRTSAVSSGQHFHVAPLDFTPGMCSTCHGVIY